MAGSRQKRRTYAARVPPEQRRTQLLDAALHLVVTRGHNAATMHAVAEQIGVTKPVIYGQFGGRAELLNALLRREQEQALAQLAAIWPNDQSFAHPSEVLPSLLSCFLDAVRDAPDRWTCIVMPMPDMPAEFHAAREQARATVLAAACELARRLGSSGPLDPEIVGHAIVALFEMAARLVLTDPDHFDPARFVAAARAAFAV